MNNRGINKKIKKLEEKILNLDKQLQNDSLSDLEYRQSLREILKEVNELLDESNSLFSLMPPKNMKYNLNLVFEAFITSNYSDNVKERTEAFLLFKELKLFLS